uniref:ENT domain-containing protein n=1 Tax=Arundo donax TaxID=35708 RepID=A0A0A9GKQ8_ARUDO
MRPCPPPSDDSVCWTVGTILEAFDSYSWKVAEVVTVLGKNHYLVRLIGSSLELGAHASDLRLRMLWQDDQWIVNQKYSARCSDGSFRGRPKDGSFSYKLGKNQQLNCAVDQNAFEGDMSRGMKRKSSAISTNPPQCSEITKRLQTPHRDGRYSKLVDRGSLRFTEMVDAVDSPCLMLGEKYMHASLNMRKNGDLKTNLSGVIADASYKWGTRTNADLSDTESISSSVGSSSPNSSPHRSQYYNLANQSGDICSRTDDVEASISERETSEHDNDGSREETHLLELHAYRATLLALYTCGSISWEQETLLTNLRLTLNISTDEHLAELRNLVSQAVTSR